MSCMHLSYSSVGCNSGLEDFAQCHISLVYISEVHSLNKTIEDALKKFLDCIVQFHNFCSH